MASFTVRVELYDATPEDYKELNVKMSLLDFTDTLSSDTGTFKMPIGEFNFMGTATRQNVLDRAKMGASSMGKKHSILVTESAGRVWTILK